MKGNFWHKLFRSGYAADYPTGKASRYNGRSAKTDAQTTRTKLNKFLNKIHSNDYSD